MAETTRLSSKGQVIIPKHLRDANQWEPGQEFVVYETEGGILLKAKRPFPATTLDEVAGSLRYHGPAKSIEEMEEAIRLGAAEQMDDDNLGASS